MCAFVNQREYENRSWTRECQGVTSDGSYWYISSNNEDARGVHRFAMDMTHRTFVSLAGAGGDHLGDIDYHDGSLYCAMERPRLLVVLPTARFEVPDAGVSVVELEGSDGGAPPQGNSMPWCAVHRNGLLYSSGFGREADPVRVVHAYRRGDGGAYRHVPEKDIVLDTEVTRIQGGCFSANGLLLSSDATDDIIAFGLTPTQSGGMSGAALHREPIRKESRRHEEVEGIAYLENCRFAGELSNVHLILLDNDFADRDDIFFKHFRIDSPYL